MSWNVQVCSSISMYLHFSDDIWCVTSFHMLICHLYILFGEVSIKIFKPMLSWIVCLLMFPQRAFLLWVVRFQVFCFLSAHLMCSLTFFQYFQNLNKYGETLFSSIQSLSHVWLFVTPWTGACQASLFINNSRSLLKLISIELMMPSNLLILCFPILFPPSIFPSIRVFSNESVLLIRWTKYWSFSINPSNECSALISFRMDWFDLL